MYGTTIGLTKGHTRILGIEGPKYQLGLIIRGFRHWRVLGL